MINLKFPDVIFPPKRPKPSKKYVERQRRKAHFRHALAETYASNEELLRVLKNIDSKRGV